MTSYVASVKKTRNGEIKKWHLLKQCMIWLNPYNYWELTSLTSVIFKLTVALFRLTFRHFAIPCFKKARNSKRNFFLHLEVFSCHIIIIVIFKVCIIWRSIHSLFIGWQLISSRSGITVAWRSLSLHLSFLKKSWYFATTFSELRRWLTKFLQEEIHKSVDCCCSRKTAVDIVHIVY